jgi:hypothetical protein
LEALRGERIGVGVDQHIPACGLEGHGLKSCQSRW